MKVVIVYTGVPSIVIGNDPTHTPVFILFTKSLTQWSINSKQHHSLVGFTN